MHRIATTLRRAIKTKEVDPRSSVSLLVDGLHVLERDRQLVYELKLEKSETRAKALVHAVEEVSREEPTLIKSSTVEDLRKLVEDSF